MGCGPIGPFGRLRACSKLRAFRHWLAESPRGVAVQLYLALIGALLLQLDLGRRPSKRIWELLQWRLLGMMDEETLHQRLIAQHAAEERRRAAARKKKTK